MPPDLLNLMLANAPAVAVLAWGFYRLELRLAACVNKQAETIARLLEILGGDDETAHTKR